MLCIGKWLYDSEYQERLLSEKEFESYSGQIVLFYKDNEAQKFELLLSTSSPNPGKDLSTGHWTRASNAHPHSTVHEPALHTPLASYQMVSS